MERRAATTRSGCDTAASVRSAGIPMLTWQRFITVSSKETFECSLPKSPVSYWCSLAFGYLYVLDTFIYSRYMHVGIDRHLYKIYAYRYGFMKKALDVTSLVDSQAWCILQCGKLTIDMLPLAASETTGNHRPFFIHLRTMTCWPNCWLLGHNGQERPAIAWDHDYAHLYAGRCTKQNHVPVCVCCIVILHHSRSTLVTQWSFNDNSYAWCFCGK